MKRYKIVVDFPSYSTKRYAIDLGKRLVDKIPEVKNFRIVLKDVAEEGQ